MAYLTLGRKNDQDYWRFHGSLIEAVADTKSLDFARVWETDMKMFAEKLFGEEVQVFPNGKKFSV